MNENSKFAVIRVDGSPALGAGHLMRCLALASALGRAGWTSNFAVDPTTARRFGARIEANHGMTILDGDWAQQASGMRTGCPDGCDLLVVDHYGLDEKFEHACRNWAGTIFVIDDLADRAHDCDVLLDPALGRTHGDYSDNVPGHSLLLLGAAYALLPPEYFETRQARLAVGLNGKKPFGDPWKMFVGFGATDAANCTSKLLRALAKVDGHLLEKIKLDIALLSAAPHLDQVRKLAEGWPDSIAVNVDAPNLPQLIAGAHIAIGTAGSMSWERCCLGVPSLIMTVADNQQPNAHMLAEAGAARFLGPEKDVDPQDLATALADFLNDPVLLDRMSRSAFSLCDGLGARRTAQIFSPPTSRDGKTVRLRPATVDDGEMMLSWQSAPETRRYSRNQEMPESGSHSAWLEKKLGDPGCIFNVVVHGEEPAGIVRFDRMTPAEPDSRDFEISILTDPGKYALGLARAALELGRGLLPDSAFHAHVVPENTKSVSLFAKAGYTRDGEWFRLDA